MIDPSSPVTPPPVISAPVGQGGSESSRLVWAWFVLSVAVLGIWGMQLGSYFAMAGPAGEVSVATERLQFRQMMMLKSLSEVGGAGGGGAAAGAAGQTQSSFRTLAESLEPKKGSEDGARLLVMSQKLGGLEIDGEALALLEGSESSESRGVAAAARGRAAAEGALSSEAGDPAVRAAWVYSERAAGRSASFGEAFGGVGGLLRLLGFIGLLGFVVLGGLGVLVWFLIERGSGRLREVGYRGLMGVGEADRGAFRFAAYLAAFLIVSVAVSPLALTGADAGVVTLAVMVGILATIPFLIKMKVAGLRDSWKAVMGDTSRPGRMVLAGAAGFLANFPVVGLVLVVTAPLFRGLPAPSHEVVSQLTGATAWYTPVFLFVAAAILVPVIEEVMFRGYLSPALSVVLRSGLWGTLLGAFIFAVVHPQGPMLYLPLMCVAITATLLTRYTGSLLPAMVMHGLHNGTILLINLLINS